jgi:hypothetical protein
VNPSVSIFIGASGKGRHTSRCRFPSRALETDPRGMAELKVSSVSLQGLTGRASRTNSQRSSAQSSFNKGRSEEVVPAKAGTTITVFLRAACRGFSTSAPVFLFSSGSQNDDED